MNAPVRFKDAAWADIRLTAAAYNIEDAARPFTATSWGHLPAGDQEKAALEGRIKEALDLVDAAFKKWPKNLPAEAVAGLLKIQHHAAWLPVLVRPEYKLASKADPTDLRIPVQQMLYGFGTAFESRVDAWVSSARRVREKRVNHG